MATEGNKAAEFARTNRREGTASSHKPLDCLNNI